MLGCCVYRSGQDFFGDLLTGPGTSIDALPDPTIWWENRQLDKVRMMQERAMLSSITGQGMNDAGKGNAVFHDRPQHVFWVLLRTLAA